MNRFFTTQLGRLRLIGLLEGISLLLLVGVAVPVKYFGNDPSLVKAIGPVHGLLFVFFVFNTITVGITYKWAFRTTTWKVLVACIIPFGTFYVDRHILAKMEER